MSREFDTELEKHNKVVQQEAMVRLCRLLQYARDPAFKGSIRLQIHAKHGRLFDLRTAVEESTTIGCRQRRCSHVGDPGEEPAEA